MGPDTITQSKAVRDLCIYIDFDLSMQVHVQQSVAGCFVVLRHLCRIRLFVPSSVYRSLVFALVLSRLDYGNATLAGFLASLLNRLQSVLSAAAQSIAGLRCSEHIEDAVIGFHWLRGPERIKVKLAVNVHQAFHGTACRYLSGQLQYVADLLLGLAALIYFQSSQRPSVSTFTVGDHVFVAAGPRLWNSLPVDVQSAPSLTPFCQKLKTHLFRQSHPDFVFSCFTIVVFEITFM